MKTPIARGMLLAAAAAFVLAGCATPAPQTPEAAVKARASERWAAMVKGDTATAYAYMAPGYRAVRSEKEFAGRRGNAVQLKGADVVEVRCPEATKCLAKVRIESKPFLMKGFKDTMETHVEETWLLEGGQWWFFEKI